MNNKLGNAKIFGGLGALLALIGGFIPYAGPVLSILGIVFVFIAVKYISDETKDHDIFKNYLISFIFSIIALVAGIVIMLIFFGVAGGFSFFSALQSANITDFTSFWEYFGTIIMGCIAGLIIGWILLLLGAIFLKRSYDSIANHTKVGLFRTTGLVNLIGAATLIIGIGFLIILIARILEIASFFSLPDKLPSATKTSKESEESS